jgi:hypothetical protein
MTNEPKKDLAASVRQRLQNKAQATGRPFQELFEYYVMERFLYRLSQSPHANKFVLKGALLFTTWNAARSRATRDIDFLARMANDQDAVAAIVRKVCVLTVEPDGVRFDPNSLQTAVIKEDADYEGVRVTFNAFLQNSRFAMQLDLGFGDVTFPTPVMSDYPTLLDFPAPRLTSYGRETVLAEKFEAMVKLGLLNSRMKDFFDLWLLSRQFSFDGPVLATAIAKTFQHRGTKITRRPTALTEQFATDSAKMTQWQAFVRKSRLDQAPAELKVVVEALAMFLTPIVESLVDGAAFDLKWNPPGPWAAK